MQDGNDYADDMSKMGFTHVYLNLSRTVHDPELVQAWIGAMGLNGGPPHPWPQPIVQKYNLTGFEQRFVPLIADAVARKRLRLVQAFKTGVLFEVVPRANP